MSRYALEWAKQQQVGDSSAKAVLLLLADHAGGRDHACYYSKDRLAHEASVSVNALGRVIKRLQTAELVTVQATPYTQLYHLLIPAGWSTPTAKRPKRDAPNGDSPTAVYRLHDQRGELLYVGISDKPRVRLDQHRLSKPWWSEVVTREITWYETRLLAGAEECRAIAFDMPRYNISDATSRAQTRAGR